MATWRDGAAYAPETRPDGFASPAADPLPEGEPYRADTPGAIERPLVFDGNDRPGVMLAGAVRAPALEARYADVLPPGTRILLTSAFGPAAVGIVRPAIVLPAPDSTRLSVTELASG